MIYYIDVLPDGKVRAGLQYDAPDIGPAPSLTDQTLGTLILVDAPVSWAGPTETSALYWKDGAYVWVETADLAAQRERKAAEMSQACNEAILAGFVSSALGAAYTYPAKPTDQANLSGSVIASILPGAGVDWTTPFWCADVEGAWEFRPHTGPQIQQVGVDAKAAILNCMTINEQLAKQIATASADQLATIAWPA